jgi:hypothetical protein
MTTTFATCQFDHAEGSDHDTLPGTIDVEWAERAPEGTTATGEDLDVRALQPRRHRRHVLNILLFLAALCACLAVVVGAN